VREIRSDLVWSSKPNTVGRIILEGQKVLVLSTVCELKTYSVKCLELGEIWHQGHGENEEENPGILGVVSVKRKGEEEELADKLPLAPRSTTTTS
jgi:hypothetical protein